MPNIGTDLIAPSHFPGKKPEEAIVLSFKDKLFANLRFFPDGTPKTDFVLRESRYQGARILLTGENFRCGSSREAGIACVIAPSFGDIFHDNAYQNSLLPLRIPAADIERPTKSMAPTNASEPTVDLEKRPWADTKQIPLGRPSLPLASGAIQPSRHARACPAHPRRHNFRVALTLS